MDHDCRGSCGCHSPLLEHLVEKISQSVTRRDFIKYTGAAAGLLAAGSTGLAASGTAVAGQKNMADLIYHGGPIVTMAEDGRRVEALAVKDGLIVDLGSKDEVMTAKGPDTKMIDLKGQCLMPGFIDPHSHVVLQSVKFSVVNLDPKPIGEVGSIADIQRLMRERIEKTKPAKGQWILGWGYDDTGIKEMRHPNRRDLDEVSTDHPILLMHISCHLMAGNSRMLEEIGVGPDTPNPEGGVIQREPGSKEPNGVLEELAMLLVLKKLPAPSPEKAVAILEKGLEAYARAGITTAQDGASSPGSIKILKTMADAGRLPIDVVAYPIYKSADEALLKEIAASRSDYGRVRLGGLKLTLDGSIQGYTAFLSQPYFVQPANKNPTPDHCQDENAQRIFVTPETETGSPVKPVESREGYRGYANMKPEEVVHWLKECDSKNIQLLAHTNGDGATDILIEAVKTVRGDQARPDLRTIIIHAQTMREDQLDFAAAHGMTPSFFPIHVYFWGDRHRDIFLGPERAARIDPAKGALGRGMKITLHHDAPVAGIDMLTVAWAAVNRVTTGNKELGPEERITPFEALRAITADAAWQYYEEKRKGTLEKGKLADLVILSHDPLAVEPIKIRDIEVRETIKQGRTIYKKSGA